MSILESSTFQSELQSQGLYQHYGWDDQLTEQILENSRQPHIEEMVPEDAGDKFSSPNKIEAWHRERFDEEDPLILWMGNAAGQLAGIAWIENAHSVSRSNIFGVRVYEGHLRKGVGTLLTEKIHAQLDQKYPDAQANFTMLRENNGGFVMGLIAKYQLNDNGLYTQSYIRNKQK